MSGQARYGIGVQNIATSGAALEFIAAASRGFYLRGINAVNTGGTFSPMAVGRPAAKGITPTGLVSFEGYNQDAYPFRKSLAQVATGWTTGPTAPTTYLGWVALPGAVGAYVAWTPTTPIYCGPGQSLVLYNVSPGNTAICLSVEIDEWQD